MPKSGHLRRKNVKQYTLCMFCLFVLMAFFNKLSVNFSTNFWRKRITPEKNTEQDNENYFGELHEVINKNNSCQENTTFLVAVMSSPIDFLRRKIIRRTWGAPSEIAAVQASLLFFVGRSTSKKVESRIEAEAATHNDIIQLGFVDDYDYLSMKTIHMMRWFIRYCGRAQWFVKTDVDAFWNIYLLKLVLSGQNQQKIIDEYEQFWMEMNGKRNIRGVSESNALNFPKRLHSLRMIRIGEKLMENLEKSKSKPNKTSQRIPQNFKSTSKFSQKPAYLNLISSNMSSDLHQFSALREEKPGIICSKAKGLVVCRKPEYDRCEKRYVVTKEEYSSELYPPHCHGFGYALQTEVVKKILHEDRERVKKGVPRFRMEDVYITGILLNNTAPKFFDISRVTASSSSLRPPSVTLLIHRPQLQLGPGSAKFLWEKMKYLHMLAAASRS